MPDGPLVLNTGTGLYVAVDPDYDQGDDPNICAACGAGQHDGCRDGAELGDDVVELCECTDGECGPPGEWQEIGYVTEIEDFPAFAERTLGAARATVTRQLNGPDLDAYGRPIGPLTSLGRLSDNGDYVKLRHSGAGQHAESPRAVASSTMTRTASPFMDLLEAEAIAGGILLPRRRDAPTIDPADVQRHRSVLAPDSVSLAGAEDEEQDELRVKANRSDYRRVGRRMGRRRL